MRMRPYCSVFLVAAVMTSCAMGSDWPQFRGAAGNGMSENRKHPLEWSAEKNVAWKAPIPGAGWSSPVIIGDRIYVTTAVSEKGEKPKNFEQGVRDLRSMPFGTAKAPEDTFRFEVYCLDRASGTTLWKQVAAEKKPGIPAHPSNTYATETPASDGERVYAHFGVIGLLVCFDNAGKKLWEKDLGVYPMTAGFGTGSSLAIADGRVFVQRDNEKKSFLVAFDGKTGKELWKIDRPGKSSWSTPYVWKNKVRTELVATGSSKVFGYDPATGKVLWELGGIRVSFTSSPAADDEQIYFGNSGPMSPGALYAVKAGATGDITPKKDELSSEGLAWMKPRAGVGMPSPLVYKGYLYALSSTGLCCYDAKTGEQKYKERLPRSKTIVASPWVANDRIHILDESGQTFMVEPGPEFKLVGVNTLADVFWSTPSLASDSLFLRGIDYVYCIRKTDGK